VVFANGRRGVSPRCRDRIVDSVYAGVASAQGAWRAGTVQGTVKDPTGGVMQSVEVKIGNPVAASRAQPRRRAGKYVLTNLPPNPYHLNVDVQGFQPLAREWMCGQACRFADLTLALAGTSTEVQVVGMPI